MKYIYKISGALVFGFSVISALMFGFYSVFFSQGEVKIYDTKGSSDTDQWERITHLADKLNPKHIVLDNGIVKITYPSTREDQKAGHVMSVYKNRQWLLAHDTGIGDWTYICSSVTTDPTRTYIAKNTRGEIELKMEFLNHTDGDNHIDGDRSRIAIPFVKSIRLLQGHYGYLATITLTDATARCEKEVGFGSSNVHRFMYSTKTGVWRPDYPGYYYVRDGKDKDHYYGVGLPSDNSLYRFIGTRSKYPASIRNAQWNNRKFGYFYHWTYSAVQQYQAYIGAVPYDGSQSTNVTKANDILKISVPKTGTYLLFSQGSDFIGTPIKYLDLESGINAISVNGITGNKWVIAPIKNGADFPVDIYNKFLSIFSTTQRNGSQ